MKTFLPALVLCLLTFSFHGCSTVGQPAEVDPATGKIKTQSPYGRVTVNVVKSEAIDLERYQGLILTLGGDFFRDQTVKLGYFDTVVDRAGMEKLLIRENLTDLVPDVTNYLSWKKISDNYRPMLVLQPDARDEGRASYFQLKAIRADTAEEVFVAEVKLDFFWKGVNDDTVFYPAFNAFIDWLNANK